MKKVIINVVLVILIFISYFLQSNFFNWFTIAGISPNLFVILIVFIGLFGNKFMGISYGILLGFFLDYLFRSKIGISAIALGLVGVFAKIFDKKELIKGIRGCNMSFFKCDCEAINGFNEEFVGWGREDSEFVARFLFNGGELRRLKFSALAYHIYHDENSRQMLEKNHQIYLNTIKNKSKWAKMGIKSNAKV